MTDSPSAKLNELNLRVGLDEVLESLVSGSSEVAQHGPALERMARLLRLQPGDGAQVNLQLVRLLNALDRAKGNFAAAALRFSSLPVELRRSQSSEAKLAAAEVVGDYLRVGNLAEAKNVRLTADASDLTSCWSALPALQLARLDAAFSRGLAIGRDARVAARQNPEIDALLAMERAIAEAFSLGRPWLLLTAWNDLRDVLPSTFGLELYLLANLVSRFAGGTKPKIEAPPPERRKDPRGRRLLLLVYDVPRADVRLVVDAVELLGVGEEARACLDALPELLSVTSRAPTIGLTLALFELATRLAQKAARPDVVAMIQSIEGCDGASAVPWRSLLKESSNAGALKSHLSVSGSWPSRTATLSLVAGKIAASLIKHRVLRGVASKGKAVELRRQEQIRLVQLLTKHLGELKGPFMKLGQQISGPITDSLPTEVATELHRLYEHSPTMAPDRTAMIVEQTLGKPADEAFRRFNPQPFAAGSVGQVHAALLPTGEDVAVKVQFEFVDAATRVDMGHLRRAAPLLRRVFPRANVDEMVDEWATMLLSETDYRREMASMATFSKLWREFPEIVVPKVHAAQSGDRVITMDRLSGVRLMDFAQTASQEARNRAAKVILRTAWHAIVHGGIFNIDPHPGNYILFGDKIGCLDFGRVKEWTPAFVKEWTILLRAAVLGEFSTFRDCNSRMGFAGDHSYDFQIAYDVFRQTEAAPYITRPFAFQPRFVREAFQTGVTRNPNLLHYKVPRDYVTVTRMNWGLFHILEVLRAEGNWWAEISDLVNLAADGDGRGWPSPAM